MLTCMLLGLAAMVGAGDQTVDTASQPFELILWLDHFDYTVGVPDKVTWSTMTPTGIGTIIDYHVRCGRPTVAFRDRAGGLVRHNSRIELGQYPQRIDKRRGWDMRPDCHPVRYGAAADDVLTSIVAACRKRSLPCIIYWPFEDCHGYPCFYGRFALEHPQYCERRSDGSISAAWLCHAYPQVRRYKLEILREELSYGVEGVMFDFCRQSGRSGNGDYNDVIVRAWRAKHGADPPSNPNDLAWIAFRAGYVTQLLREVRGVLDSVEPRRRLICAVPNAGPDPEPSLRSYLTDWPTWVDEGLLDGLAVSALPTGKEQALADICRAMAAIHKRVGDRCKVYWPMKWYGNWTVDAAKVSGMSLPDFLREYVRRAWQAGAAGFVMDTYDYRMNGMTDQTQAVLAELFTKTYPRMKPGRVRTPRRVEVPLPHAHTPTTGPDEPDLRRVTAGPGEDDEPSWSPNGKQIAFQSDRAGNLDVWVVPAQGGPPKRMTDSPANDCYPTWSTDGRRIAFASDRGGMFYHIFVMDADGGQVRQLTNGSSQDYLPAWSPDDKWIYFTTTRGGEFNANIWRVPVRGGKPESVISAPVSGSVMCSEATPLPAGDVAAVAYLAGHRGPWSVGICVLEKPQPDQLLPITDGRHIAYAPALHPTGDLLAYAGVPAGAYDICVQRPGAAKSVRVTRHPANDVNPCWSPDGKQIAFASNRTGRYKIYALPAPPVPTGAATKAWHERLAKLRDQARRAARDVPYRDQFVGPRFRTSQATAGYHHQVGQSFIAARSGKLFKLRLYATHDEGDAPLKVTLRQDANGKPAGRVLAETDVPRDAFTHTPRYTWVEARFAEPPAVEAGKTYWIYLPLSGRYHWAVDSRNRYKRGQAFSDRYDYAHYDWIFEVYVK